ncbi:MAG: hypothetical protein AB7K68_07400 [Bacteriovoracia bacterium]
MRKIAIVGLGLNFFSPFALADNHTVHCFIGVGANENMSGQIKNLSGTDNVYLEKSITPPDKGEVTLTNKDERFSYFVKFANGKVDYMALRDEKVGINASRTGGAVKVPKDEALAVILRKDLTSKAGEKIEFSQLSCAGESLFKKMLSRAKKKE